MRLQRQNAILSLKVDKSPGLNMLPVECFKKYIDILPPVLTGVYTEAFRLGTLLDTFNEAS